MPNHKPYDLTTEHGRAQCYAHGGHGAFLVKAVEQSLADKQEAIVYELETLITTAASAIDWDAVRTDELIAHLAQFRQELGHRDAAAFLPMYTAYGEERKRVQKVVEDLTELINQIRKILDVPGEPL